MYKLYIEWINETSVRQAADLFLSFSSFFFLPCPLILPSYSFYGVTIQITQGT